MSKRSLLCRTKVVFIVNVTGSTQTGDAHKQAKSIICIILLSYQYMGYGVALGGLCGEVQDACLSSNL